MINCNSIVSVGRIRIMTDLWTNLKTFSMLITVTGLMYVTIHTVQADDSDVLQHIFAEALARDVTSLEAFAVALDPEWAKTLNVSSWNSTCLNSANNSASSNCLQTPSQCMSLKDLWTLYNTDPAQSLSPSDVSAISPALLYSLLSCSEQHLQDLAGTAEGEETNLRPPSAASWGYSFLFVTLINLSSLTGAIVLPCMKFKAYKIVLMFMVALAVGTLAGSSLLFLIPEAFLLGHDEDSGYIWKSTTIIGGIYLFYITEKLMRMVNARRENTKFKKQNDELATKEVITTSFRPIPIDTSIPQKDPSHLPRDVGGMCGPQRLSSSSSESSIIDAVVSYERTGDETNGPSVCIVNNGSCANMPPSHPAEKSVSNGTSKHSHHHNHHAGEVAPVAYMIIFGDALHNFIDGLSIGSAFTQSIMTGVSVSVAVLCEELPHELGDFAILLNSGMHFRKAILYNFLSACTCYVGTAIGIVLGENTSAHEWIFAVAGGMFLYISLVDMVPEMNSAAESEEGREFGEMKTFLLQNAGLLTGYGILLIFAVYGGNISFE